MEKQIVTRKVQVYVNEKDKDIMKNHYKNLESFQKLSWKMSNEIMNIRISYFNSPHLYLRSGEYKSEEYVNICSDITKLNLQESNTSGDELKSVRSQLKKKFSEKSRLEKDFRKKMIETLQTSEQNLCYKLLTKEYDVLPSFIKSATTQKISKDFSNSLKGILSGTKTYNCYKRTNPVMFVPDTINNLKKDSKDKNFTFNFCGIPLKTRLGRDSSNNEIILDRVLAGEYQIKTSSYKFDDGKLFFLLCIEMPNEKKDSVKLDKKVVMGIDLGIKQPICISVSNHKYPINVGNAYSISEMKKRFISERAGAAKISRESKTGHGRERALKKFNLIKRKERNFTNTMFHKYSKDVVDIALRYKVSKIVMEELSGLDKEKMLKTFSPNTLQNFIETKVKPYGIEVVYINPAYTSQTCSECGFVNEKNRETRDNFLCISCDHKSNADFNAAKNIIKKSEEKQKKVDEILGF